VDGLSVRRNYLSLTDGEREAFHDAVLRMKEAEVYDDAFVLSHLEAFYTATPPDGSTRECGAAHNCAAFLPWHRAYLLEFERQLQIHSGNNSMTLPYWDWLADGTLPRPDESIVWTDAYMGRNGNPDSNYEVQDGPFANWPLKYEDPLSNHPNPNHLLQRQLAYNGFLRLPTHAGFEAALGETTYDTFPYNVSTNGFRSAVEGPGNAVGDQMHNM